VTTRVRASAREDHGRAIEAALEHIARGDIYQVNLARRWMAGWEGDPLALFLAMREASPVPLGFYVGAGDHAVLALTMETFLDWEGLGGRLATRPIKGTIARGADAIADARALRADPKEHAEHAMIVDLMRNDLGRVAATVSVKVERLMEVEPYAGLSHLVSTVACTTREGVTLDDVLAATFPPGSVTGAPKVRAMEIIDALEPHPRRVYCGAVGMIDRAGGARFAVAIRTAQVRAGTVTYHAGGGLVAASVVEREIAETELKARVFLDAVASLRTPPRSADITARAR
jgi:anthranilate/para-aminobenzoate synthase component I